MDEPHTLAALRHVSLNPVRAGLTAGAQDWKWSGVHALLDPDSGDGITHTAPVRAGARPCRTAARGGRRRSRNQGPAPGREHRRPVGSARFFAEVEASLGRDPRKAKRGRKPRTDKELSALSPQFQAAFIQEVLVPDGTSLLRSRALPQPAWGRVRGGAEQFELEQHIPTNNFGPGRPLP